MGLVGLAHCVSHFSQLLLPPLFPWLKDAFHASYAELGFLLTVFFVVSCAVQTVSGFVVDRFGPRPILFGGIALLAAAAFGFAASTSYAMLVAFAVVAGVGNGVFHPVDYTLLNRKINAARLGHAFSVHGITGSLGWALAPAILVPIALAFSWRVALVVAGVLALVVLVVPGPEPRASDDRDDERRGAEGGEVARRRKQLCVPRHSRGLDVLRLLLPLCRRARRHPGVRSRVGTPAP